MVFPKTSEYVLTLCCIHKMLYDKSRATKDQTLYLITVMILKYIKKACDELGIDTRTLAPTAQFDLAPLYTYIRDNQIHLYDLTILADGDMDSTKDADVERFILSHITYIFTRPEQQHKRAETI
jgi:hypothetical protein